MHRTQVVRWATCVCALLAVAAWLAPMVAHAEAMPVKLSVQRLNGADLLGRVAGTFRLTVDAPQGVHTVTFYLDGRIVGQATSYPFTFGIDTGDFPKGTHQLEAVAHFSDGAVATSNSVSLDFRWRNWQLAVRQSMFLYAGLVPALGVLGGLLVRRLLRIQPRLTLLDR